MEMVETDVLVVGAGPTGLTASALLASYGVDAVTVTKHSGTAPTPRAHFINQRTMEGFRDLGIEQGVRAAGTSISSLGNTVWATSFAGPELARRRSWGTGPDRRDEYEASSPCGIWNVPQHRLEPVVISRAQELGADIRFRSELVTLHQDADCVLATIRDRADGRQHRIRARFVLGADGARSTVATQAGFDYEHDTGVMNWGINVWVDADLAAHCSHRPGLLYWIHQPGGGLHSSSAWICVRPWHEWVMALVYPASHTEPRVDEATALEHASAMVDDPNVNIRIKAISPWAVGAALAREYLKGRVLLAGDSAHRHPPPNGLGLNTGIQDAFNLCWKLAAICSDAAGISLLDTYHAERQPVARDVIRRATDSLRNMDHLLAAFGLEPDRTEAESQERLSTLASGGERGRQCRRELRDALLLQDGQLNDHGMECGQRYAVGAVIADDNELPARADRDQQLRYEPSTIPGSPLPHAWLERTGIALSSLDIADRGGFTVITGIGGSGWVSAAQHAAHALGVPIRGAVVDHDQEYHDVYGDWARLRDIDGSGCLLVRPDRYIAWRSHTAVDDPVRTLTNTMRQLLARPS
ncbi:MAG: 2,4-dichlorophenol 6-monooxygenase [Pseudonocardiaceae bacterium]|nr:2,4-dichlorophenol 6-monooxygenase [Pseudonocardiaceae bacterium]